jgi:hypothetical protein
MDGALEIKYSTLIYLASATGVTILLIVLISSKASCSIAWKSIGPGVYSVISTLFTLCGYAISTLMSIYDTLYFSTQHLHLAWYFLAAFTIVPICVNISKSMSIPFLALYCITALVICCRLPSAPTKQTKALDSQFFTGMRITIA